MKEKQGAFALNIRLLRGFLSKGKDDEQRRPADLIISAMFLISTQAAVTLLIVGVSIFLVYALGAVYVIGALFYFKNRLRKKIVALSILFAEKKDLLLSVFQLYDEAKLPLEEADRKHCSRVRWLKTEVVKDKDVVPISEILAGLEKRLTLIAENEPYIKRSEELTTLLMTLKDVDASYRRIVNVYNADVAGYMYWRKFFLYRWLSFLFGFTKKERIV